MLKMIKRNLIWNFKEKTTKFHPIQSNYFISSFFVSDYFNQNIDQNDIVHNKNAIVNQSK